MTGHPAITTYKPMKVETPPTGMLRFQVYITREQYEFLRQHAFDTRTSAGIAIRKGIQMFAKKHGVELEAEPTP